MDKYSVANGKQYRSEREMDIIARIEEYIKKILEK
jgi:hypothetical protein